MSERRIRLEVLIVFLIAKIHEELKATCPPSVSSLNQKKTDKHPETDPLDGTYLCDEADSALVSSEWADRW